MTNDNTERKVQERIKQALQRGIGNKIKDLVTLRIIQGDTPKESINPFRHPIQWLKQSTPVDYRSMTQIRKELSVLYGEYEYNGKRYPPVFGYREGRLFDLDTRLEFLYALLDAEIFEVKYENNSLYHEERNWYSAPDIKVYIPGEWENRLEQLQNPEFLRSTLVRYKEKVEQWDRESKDLELKKRFGLE